MTAPLPDWVNLDWRAHHRVLDAAGQPIHLVEMGPPDAPALVLLHGWTGCWQHWVEQFGHFSSDHRVIAVDLPGFGGSPMPEGEISIEAYAETVVDVLDALGLERTTLVGSSMGGGVAAQVALDAPDRVEGLVLVAATGLSPRYLLFPAAFIRHPANRRTMSLLFRETALPRRLAYGLASRPRLRKAALSWVIAEPSALSGPMAVELIGGAGRPGAAAAAAALATTDISGRLADIQAPTLVLWGTRDHVVGFSCAQRFADGIPQARLVVFEGAGHLPMIERTERFNAELRGFLERDRGHTTVTSNDVTSSSDNVVTH